MNMTTLELKYLLNIFTPSSIYSDVCASNMLPVTSSKKIAIIVNNEPIQMGGGHWVAFFRDVNGSLEFFDSLAIPIELYSKDFTDFACRISSRLTYNKFKVQENNTTTCGAFCLFFLLHRIKGYKFNDIMNRFSSSELSRNNTMVLYHLKCLNNLISDKYVRTDRGLKCGVNQICKPCCY